MAEILKLPSPLSKHFVPGLRRLFMEYGYKEKSFVVRHFDRKRIDQLINTGTDRDKGSKIWDTDCDVNHRKLKEQGIYISPENILYASSWKLDPEYDGVVISHDINGNENYYYLDSLDNITLYNLAIYNRRLVEKKSYREYWFKYPGDKLSALLGVIIISRL